MSWAPLILPLALAVGYLFYVVIFTRQWFLPLPLPHRREAVRIFVLFYTLLSSGSSSGFEKEIVQFFHSPLFKDGRIEKGMIRAMRRYIYAVLGPIKCFSLEALTIQREGLEYHVVGRVNFQKAASVKCQLHWEPQEVKTSTAFFSSPSRSDQSSSKIKDPATEGIRCHRHSCSPPPPLLSFPLASPFFFEAKKFAPSLPCSSTLTSSISRDMFLPYFYVHSFQIIVPEYLRRRRGGSNGDLDSRSTTFSPVRKTFEFFFRKCLFSPLFSNEMHPHPNPKRRALSVVDFMELDDFLEVGEDFLRCVFTPSRAYDIAAFLSPGLQFEYQKESGAKRLGFDAKMRQLLGDAGGMRNGVLDFTLLDSRFLQETSVQAPCCLTSCRRGNCRGWGKKNASIISSFCEEKGRRESQHLSSTKEEGEASSCNAYIENPGQDEKKNLVGFSQLYVVHGKCRKIQVEIWFTLVKLCCRVFRFEVKLQGNPCRDRVSEGGSKETFRPLEMRDICPRSP